MKKAPSRNRTKPAHSFHHLLHRTYPSGLPFRLARRLMPRHPAAYGNPLFGNDALSHNGGMPCRTTRPGALSRPRPPSRWPCPSGNPAPVFCPACSEAIFTVPLLAPVSHPHRLAGAFPEQLLSSSWHLLSVTFFLIYHYNLPVFCLSSRIRIFRESIFCGYLLSFPENGCRHAEIGRAHV